MARTPAPPAAPTHYVVDGSNIATEGRAMPSLKQLNDAVMAFIDEHPDALITVVVDATFGHRIGRNEVDGFDQAVANNELVTPPAGAVGRGDAFVLTIAHKAKAGILSNDSFQEFHGDYPWLFDPGRLIGGKPVPHVGWVFVERLPVRGPRSRQSVKDARTPKAPPLKAARGSGSPLAEQPMPVPTAPPPGIATAAVAASASTTSARAKRPAESPDMATIAAAAKKPATKTLNDLIPFLEFVEQHPVGTSATVVVENYASHGAYARAGDVLVYLPLRLMGNPVPRSARSEVSIGEAVAVVIAGYTPERRSIDAALPSAAEAVLGVAPPAPPSPEAAAPAAKPRKRTSKRGAAAEPAEPARPGPVVDAPLQPAPVLDAPAATPKRGGRKKAAAAAAAEPAAPPSRRRSRTAATPAADEVATPAPEPAAATKQSVRQPVKQPVKKAAKKAAKSAAKKAAKGAAKKASAAPRTDAATAASPRRKQKAAASAPAPARTPAGKRAASKATS